MNSLSSQGRPWTSGPPASISLVLGLQCALPSPAYHSAEVLTQGFIRQSLYPLNHINCHAWNLPVSQCLNSYACVPSIDSCICSTLSSRDALSLVGARFPSTGAEPSKAVSEKGQRARSEEKRSRYLLQRESQIMVPGHGGCPQRTGKWFLHQLATAHGGRMGVGWG